MLAPLILSAALLTISPLQPETPPRPAAEQAATPAEPPRWTWRKGDTSRYLITQRIETSAEGMLEYNLSQTQKQQVRVEVEDVTPSGEASLKVTLESIEVSTVPAKGSKAVAVSSEAAPVNEEFDPNGPCRALVGLTLTIVAAPDGTLREIRGLATLRDRVKAILSAPTLSNLAADVLASLDEAQLRSRFEPALLLDPGESQKAPVAVTFRGLGTLEAKQSAASMADGGVVTVHRTTDFSLRSPSTDDLAAQFDIALSAGRAEVESTLAPASGTVRKVVSSLTLVSTLSPKKAVQGAAKTTRSVTQTLLIEPVTDSNPAVTPPGATGKP